MREEHICLACAEVFAAKGGRFVTCPECGFSVGRGRYNRITSFAYDAVRYGYEYRTEYEKQADEEGDITCHYHLLDTEQVLVFAGVAAASGIIGNAAYDLVKAVIRKVLEKAVPKNQKATLQDLATNDAELQKFIEYVRQYCHGLGEVEKKILKCIKEEMLVEKFTSETTKALKKGKRIENEDIFRQNLRKNIRALDKKQAPNAADFNKAWSQLQLPGVNTDTDKESNQEDAPDQKPVR